MISRIQHKATYNNYIKEVMDELEDAQAEFAVFARLLAMECELKDWLAEQMLSDTPAVITDTMLDYCEDHCTAAAHLLNKETTALIQFLDNYWRTTAEVNVGEN